MSLSSLTIVAAGLVIGLLLGLTGGGGSILTVPLLVYVIGLDAKIAIATSLLIVGLASMAALLPHSRSGNVYWRTGLIFGVAGMAGAYSGGRLAVYFADAVLLLLFAAVMIGSGTAMIRRKAPAPCPEGETTPRPERSWLKIVVDGFVVGIVTGLVGAGGGFLVVPALALLGGLPMHAAVGTSLLVIAMKCFAGLAGYVAHVPIDTTAAVVVGLFAIGGTLVGSRLSRVLSGGQLQKGFGIFVLCIAAILVVIEGSALIAGTFAIERSLAMAGLIAVGCLVVVPLLVRAAINGARSVQPRH